MHNFIRHFIIWLALLGVLRAQTPNIGPRQEDQVSLQFRLLAWQMDIPELTYSLRKKIPVTEVDSYSPPQTYAGPTALVFTRPSKKSDANQPAPVIASVLLPRDAARVTLITIPTGGGRYAMYPVAESDTILPPRHARLHNLTSGPLLIGYGDYKTVELASASSVLITAPGKGLVIRVAGMANGKWHELFNNVIALQDTEGSNVVLASREKGAAIGMFILPGWPSHVPEKELPAP